ncbi:hypothetical protein [Streptomyces sp. NPDC054808]
MRAQASRAWAERPEVVVEVPEAVQESHEPGAVLDEVARVEGPGQFTAGAQGDLGR